MEPTNHRRPDRGDRREPEPGAAPGGGSAGRTSDATPAGAAARWTADPTNDAGTLPAAAVARRCPR